jgi:tRNA threonylcarbamoyladenosine biosynthesis protein TsaB
LALILNIETATTVCSVSVSHNQEVLAFKELDNGFTHAENLHLFIKGILATTKIKLNALSAICVSRGPGSYTGLRIGTSTAKGLAYALKIPMLSVDTLQVMAAAAKESMHSADYYCPMLDARRMEIYTGTYNNALKAVSPVEARILNGETISLFERHATTCYFGNGMDKCRLLLESLQHPVFIEGIQPSAKWMAGLAWQKWVDKEFEDVAYFEPFYLKDFLIVKKQGK